MAKFKKRLQARKLRRAGQSIKAIAKRLEVSKASVSIWCRDIELTKRQIAFLNEQQILSGYAGRMKGARMQHEKKIQLVKSFQQEGYKDLSPIHRRDILLAGIGLYAGEGFKYRSIAGFSNSDPLVIRFIMQWFRKICGVSNDRFSLQIGINQMHRYRIQDVEKFWQKLTRIRPEQFHKVSYKKIQSKKIYDNPEKHFGTLMIRIKKSALLNYQILGWVHALLKN